MGEATRPAVGARTVIHYGEETSFGVLASSLDKVLRFTSESITNEINYIVSSELRADRARSTSVRGSASVGGDVNVEQNMEGLGILLKHALGDVYDRSFSDTSAAIQGVDGGIAAITIADFDNDSGTTIDTDRDLVAEGFINTGGDAIIVRRLSTGVLEYEGFTYTGIAGTGNYQFTGVGAIGGGTLSEDYVKGSRIFAYDSTNWAGVYTHILDASRDLPAGLSMEILRDIVAFIYTGMKVNTLTETFPVNDVCTAVFGFNPRLNGALDCLIKPRA